MARRILLALVALGLALATTACGGDRGKLPDPPADQSAPSKD